MRGGRKPSAAGQEMDGIERPGSADRQTVDMLCAIIAVARKLAGTCIECGSAKPTSMSGSVPRSRSDCD
jgi:hypothetical protein